MSLSSRNPATGKIIAEYQETTRTERDDILNRAMSCFRSWRDTSFKERAGVLHRAAEILLAQAEPFGRLMAEEMGKPITQGIAEAKKCAWVCSYYADHAEEFLADIPVATDADRSYVAFQPLGPVLAVMPWNFPFWQVFRFAAPAIMAGNAAILKHASNVTGSALAIRDIFTRAGAPDGLFSVLVMPGRDVAGIIADPRIAAVTLTGSTPAGRAVARAAGAALKKSLLELGGSDPYIILEDADLDQAAKTCVASRLINSGQSCIAAKRFIVVESVRDEFEQLVTEAMTRAHMGDPLQPETEVGPLARLDLRSELHRQVTESVAQGAKLLTGGAVPKGPGAFYPPTVLTDVTADSPCYREETFGPVAAIIPVADERQAVTAANDTSFGLGAAVFSRDLERAERVAKRLEAGSCFVNGFVKSDPRLPFGGIKESGYGRELGSFGIREFVNIKTVWVRGT